MVCLGNICRSPIAEGLLKTKIKRHNLQATVDSCGFEYEHLGCQPDYRAIEVASKHDIDITYQKARLFHPSYFDHFDKIYVMDNSNYKMVASHARCSKDLEKVEFIMNVLKPGSNESVPDPYYGKHEHFVETFNLLDKATDKIVDLIKDVQKN
jgi:protein-tyrosine phosphatase